MVNGDVSWRYNHVLMAMVAVAVTAAADNADRTHDVNKDNDDVLAATKTRTQR